MRVLFFMREASRTGAEIALCNLIRHASGKGMDMGVAAQLRGEMLGELPPDVPVVSVYRWRLLDGARTRAGRYLPGEPYTPEDRFVMDAHAKFRPDVWYVNTVLQPNVVQLAKRHGVPCVLHAHEMEPMLFALSEGMARDTVAYPKLLIAGSGAAREMFRTLGRERDVEVCYATIDPATIKTDPEKSKAIRRRLGLGEKTFVWAMSGTLDPNKNPVRLVEVAHAMSEAGRDVHFIWLGGTETGYSLYAKELAERLGVAGRVSWLGARSEDYYDHLNAANGFVLTSSSESFSLVSVEAAYLGKPVVAFGCGGIREIVAEGMGTVVNSWNTSDLVREMAAVMAGETSFDPRVSRERVKEFFIDAQGPRWLGFMRNYLCRARRAEARA